MDSMTKKMLSLVAGIVLLTPVWAHLLLWWWGLLRAVMQEILPSNW